MLEGHRDRRTEITSNKQARQNGIACEQISPARQIETSECRKDGQIDRLQLRANKLARLEMLGREQKRSKIHAIELDRLQMLVHKQAQRKPYGT